MLFDIQCDDKIIDYYDLPQRFKSNITFKIINKTIDYSLLLLNELDTLINFFSFTCICPNEFLEVLLWKLKDDKTSNIFTLYNNLYYSNNISLKHLLFIKYNKVMFHAAELNISKDINENILYENINMLKILPCCENILKHIEFSVLNNKVKSLEYFLRINKENNKVSSMLFSKAAELGLLDVCKILYLYKIEYLNSYVASNAAMSGNIEMLEWMKEFISYDDMFNIYVFDCATEKGQYDVCMWLIKNNVNGMEIFDEDTIEYSIISNNIKLVEFLWNYFNYDDLVGDELFCEFIMKNGNENTKEFFRTKGIL